ncbi:MAG: hypothetical protein H6737_13080 [Alphaproteobacteria bacterium]|nr:hypothetical protein [Alphaproteobacteria bacterium]
MFFLLVGTLGCGRDQIQIHQPPCAGEQLVPHDPGPVASALTIEEGPGRFRFEPTGAAVLDAELEGEEVVFTWFAFAGEWMARVPECEEAPYTYAIPVRALDGTVEWLGGTVGATVELTVPPDAPGKVNWIWRTAVPPTSALAAALAADVGVASVEKVDFAVHGTLGEPGAQASGTLWGAPGEGSHSLGPYPLTEVE